MHKPTFVQPPHTLIALIMMAYKAMSDKTSAVLKMPTLTQPHHTSNTQVMMIRTAHLKRWAVCPQLGEALAPSLHHPRERQRNLNNTRLWLQRLPHVHCRVETPNWWSQWPIIYPPSKVNNVTDCLQTFFWLSFLAYTYNCTSISHTPQNHSFTFHLYWHQCMIG